MIRKTFVNRREELTSLKNHHQREGFESIVINGTIKWGEDQIDPSKDTPRSGQSRAGSVLGGYV